MKIPETVNVDRVGLLGPIRELKFQSTIVGIKVIVEIKRKQYIGLYK